MPELPEVETVKRVIGPQIKGRLIENVIVNRPEVISHPGAEEFCSKIKGQTISGMERRGKFLMIFLDSGDQIIVHLRMTGCLLLAAPEIEAEKHTHVVFYLNDGNELRFSDTRRFGRLWLIGKDEEDIYSGIKKLGSEPLEQGFSAGYLKERLKARKRAIKECLLDQNAVAGIGNIYSDEILFTAKIHPVRPACSLTEEEWERLAAAIRERLAYFIEKNQITPEEYLETKGKDYRNTPFLQVYGHENEPCPVCGKTLRRIVIGGRSSVFCPGCQR